MVGCSLGMSRLWFTIGGGIVNEVYYPRVDIPQIRDLGLPGGRRKRVLGGSQAAVATYRRIARTGHPCGSSDSPPRALRAQLRVVPCVERDALLIDVALTGDEDLRPYALLAPHLGGTGLGNQAEVVDHGGRRLLWAQQGPFALALAAISDGQRDAFGRASAGYVGASDGWQDFARNGAMTWEYSSAGPGNVALMGELPRASLLALAFGSSPESAATLALTALFEPFERTRDRHIAQWTRVVFESHGRRRNVSLDSPAICAEQFHISTMVLRAHQDKTYPGAMVASLSIPWGNTKEEREGYHLVWPRDLVECAGALLAVGAVREAGNTLRYLWPHSSRMGIGTKINGLAGHPIGLESSWMRRRCRCCWRHCSPSAIRANGPKSPTWFGVRCRTSCAMGRRAIRIGGRKARA